MFSARPLSLLLGALIAASASGCVVPGDTLEGKECPCAEGSGWVCNRLTNLCEAGPAAAPPPVPTTCWVRAEGCDWSDPTAFTFEPDDGSGLGDVSRADNVGFSPDACTLYYDASRELRHARRASADAPFEDQGALPGLEQAGTEQTSASITPDGLQLFFARGRAGEWVEVERATRADVESAWGPSTRVDGLSFSGVDNWDGLLAPHGLRYYWSPARPGGQDVFVASRAALEDDFDVGVRVDELAGPGNQAEVAVTADDRVVTFVSNAPELGGEHAVVYATRERWGEPFGPIRAVPGALLAEATEFETTVSPDGCELLIQRDGRVLRLLYTSR